MKTNHFFIVAVSSLFLNACSFPMGLVGIGNVESISTDFSSSAATVNADLQPAAFQILNQNCTACHGENSGSANIYGLTNLNHLISTGLVVPGEPNQSFLLRVIENGSMPPAGPLSASDKEILRLWILGGGSSPGGPTPGPNPVPVPTPTPTPPPNPSDVQGLALRVLAQNCTACHGETSGSAGVYGLNDVSHMVSSGLIVPGNPGQSSLFLAIRGGTMPPRGPLSQADQDLISQWITSEVSTSPNPAPVPAPAPVATFAYINSELLVPKCVACHTQGNAKGGFNFDTYQGVKRAVSVTKPTSSLLYKETRDGNMPPRPGTPLSSDQVDLILRWIQGGALNN